MKKTSIIKIASLTLLLGSFVGLAANNKNDFKLFEETTEVTKDFGDTSKAVALKNTPKKLSGDVLASDVGVQISNVDENGNRAIRFIAQISDLSVDASFVREMYDESGNVFQSSASIDVKYAYTSIRSGSEVIYPSEGYNYFITYTLRNVPEAYWFHALNVKVVVNGEEETRDANIEGVMIDPNVTYSNNASVPSKSSHPAVYSALEAAGYTTKAQLYQAKLKTGAVKSSITKISIDKWAKEIPDSSKPLVAKKLGPVIQTAYVSSGAFGGLTNLKEVSLPDSEFFYYIYGSSFKSCASLEEFTFPKYISNIGSGVFTDCTSLKTIHFNTMALRSTSNPGIGSLDNLYIDKDVSFIPNNFFENSIKNVYYSGSNEEWNAFKAKTYNASSTKGYTGFGTNAGISYVVCSDTQKGNAIFHFEGASLVVDGVTYNDQYVFNDYEGLSVSNPGSPFAEGKRFGGWFADTNYENRLTEFGTLVNGTDLEYYAEFETEVAGMSVENPIMLSEGTSKVVSTTWAMPHAYFKFVPTKSDVYYFSDVCEEEGAFARSGAWLFDENMKQLAYTDSGKFALSYLLVEGQTYYLKAGSYASSIDGYGWSKGKIQVEISTKAGDSMYEAIVVEQLEEDIEIKSKPSGISSYFEFEPKVEGDRYIRINAFKVGSSNPGITVYNKKDGSVVYEEATLNSDSSYKDLQYKDYVLDFDNTYIFEVSGGSGDYSFRLDKTPEGASVGKALSYTLESEINPINFNENGGIYKSGSYVFYTSYFKFTPNSSFDANINVKTTSTSTTYRMYAKIYENGEELAVDGLGSESSLLSKDENGIVLSKELSFVQGKEYIVNINVRGGRSSNINNDTSFSIVPVIENPDEGDDEPIVSDTSLENPIEVVMPFGDKGTSWGNLVANTPKHFKFTVDQWNYIKFDCNVSVKIYEESDLSQPIYESTTASNCVDLTEVYSGTFVMEVISSSDTDEFRPWYQLY